MPTRFAARQSFAIEREGRREIHHLFDVRTFDDAVVTKHRSIASYELPAPQYAMRQLF